VFRLVFSHNTSSEGTECASIVLGIVKSAAVRSARAGPAAQKAIPLIARFGKVADPEGADVLRHE
jgi:hypothetical protein